MDGAEDPVGVVGQPLGAVLELLASLGRARRGEHVPGRQLPVPAAQPRSLVIVLTPTEAQRSSAVAWRISPG